ncbi:MAG: exodeoxyribonuclease III [Candidatus Nanopelagicales bacterium]|nr:exodeoxyribonuclease III [Candidatus Nanopelagicales bacterium]
MRIATWNVNSVGARLERLLAWLELNQPDVVALQELKCTSEAFPTLAVQALGYEVAALGTGRWNGVALLSRVGLSDVTLGLQDQPQYEGADEPRAIAATCGGVRIWGIYAPNGRETDHDHFAYKLRWFQALRATAAAELAAAPDLPLTIIGDYNIAPTDADVWDIAKFVGSTHVTAQERAELTALQSIGLGEVLPRALKGEPFTFWDYRQASFGRGWGMRIDLVYGNAAFTSLVSDAYVDREERKGKGASDHAPVVIDLDLP